MILRHTPLSHLRNGHASAGVGFKGANAVSIECLPTGKHVLTGTTNRAGSTCHNNILSEDCISGSACLHLDPGLFIDRSSLLLLWCWQCLESSVSLDIGPKLLL